MAQEVQLVLESPLHHQIQEVPTAQVILMAQEGQMDRMARTDQLLLNL
jgi:hypothetical protein